MAKKTALTHRKVKYSKMVIKQALFELLETHPLSKITVKGLCDLADVNRGTFYTHYTDINDLIGQLENELTELSQPLFNTDEDPRNAWEHQFEDIFNHIKMNIENYKLVLLNPPSMRCLNPLMERAYRQHLARFSGNRDLPPRLSHYIFNFYSAGCYSVLVEWINNGFEESPAEMGRLLKELTEPQGLLAR